MGTNENTAPANNTAGWWYEEFDDDITGNEPFIIREARESGGPDGGVRAIATVMLTDSREDTESNAEFIVRACNAHADLREACTMMANWIERLPVPVKKRHFPQLADPEAVSLLWVYDVIDKANG